MQSIGKGLFFLSKEEKKKVEAACQLKIRPSEHTQLWKKNVHQY